MDAPPVQYARTSDGYDIAYTVSGEGRPLVLLLGGFGHVQQSRGGGLVRGLASRYRLVHLDLRGQGLSTRGLPEVISMRDFVRDIEAVVDRVGLDRFVLYGTTGNGHPAVFYAVDHPGRVEALILAASAVEGTAYSTGLYEVLREEDWDRFVRSQVRPFARSAEEEARLVERWKQFVTPDDHRRRFRALRTSSLREALPRLAAPTLVLQAQDYIDLAREEATKLAALIPDSRLVFYEGASPVGDPGQALEAVDNFLASHPPGEQPRLLHISPAEAGLSPRKTEVLRLIARGRTNRQIADELFISIHTVDRHLRNIFAKTEVGNRTEAAAYAIHQGLTADN